MSVLKYHATALHTFVSQKRKFVEMYVTSTRSCLWMELNCTQLYRYESCHSFQTCAHIITITSRQSFMGNKNPEPHETQTPHRTHSYIWGATWIKSNDQFWLSNKHKPYQDSNKSHSLLLFTFKLYSNNNIWLPKICSLYTNFNFFKDIKK